MTKATNPRRRRPKIEDVSPKCEETVEQYMTSYLQHVKGSDTFIYNTRASIKVFIIPKIGHLRMAAVTWQVAEDLYATIRSPNRRTAVHRTLNRAFERAVRDGKLSENPIAFAESPDYARPFTTRIPMATPQIDRLMKYLDGHHYHALVWTAILTGMREGELFGLQREDVDLVNGRISVHRALKESPGTGAIVLSHPKTRSSIRVVDMPAQLTELMREHFAKIDAERNPKGLFAGYVFLTERGKPIRKSNWGSKFWPGILEEAGLPHLPFHALRHTMATLLLSANVHPKVVQERLGHSSVKLTLDTYSHVVPTLQKEAAEKLDGMFRKNGELA